VIPQDDYDMEDYQDEPNTLLERPQECTKKENECESESQCMAAILRLTSSAREARERETLPSKKNQRIARKGLTLSSPKRPDLHIDAVIIEQDKKISASGSRLKGSL